MRSYSLWRHRALIIARIAAKKGYCLLGALNHSLQPKKMFSIKTGYHHAVKAEQHDATGSTDEWQPSVYELAVSIAKKLQDHTIIDLGCGSGYKLIHKLGNFDTIGIEVQPTYSWLKKKYPERKWLLFDSVNPSELEAGLVICSDVIEHIPDPDKLMEFIQKMNFDWLIISTPERDAVAGKNDYGPPRNTAHYREWNVAEFNEYVNKWFEIEEHHVFNDRSITQVVVCTKRKK
jgi:2-polyprenyl-3-methyl-5-hydroxy-6-metoxy-1,4-benzoquinol methylase